MAKKQHKIVLCGHYGATNIGDEAIGLSIVQKLHNERPEAKIVIMSYNPESTKQFYNKFAKNIDISSVYLLPLGIRSVFRGIFKGELWHTLKEIWTCDQFILGGGGLFTDERMFAIFLWGIHAFWAYLFRKPVTIVGQSIGPLRTKIGKWVVKKVFSGAKYINVRDRNSKKLLEKIGIKNKIVVTSDAVFGLQNFEKNEQNCCLRKLNKKIEQKGCSGYFIFSIRPWSKKFEKKYKIFIQTICEIGVKNKLMPVFIPFQLIKENDQLMLYKKIAQNECFREIEILEYNDNIFEVLSIISNAKFTIGVRLHSLIFSVLMKVPCIAFSYSQKIENFMSDIGMQEFIIEDFEKISDLIEKNYKEKNEIYEKLTKVNKDFIKTWSKQHLVL